MGSRYFTPKLFAFLRDLAQNNDRDWFKAHQSDYEQYVREPALDFITDFAGPLAKISDNFVADSRTVGGSLFRIQRDTRFSKDKTPYKPNTGMQFRHIAGKDAHAPGFYLHLQPGECFLGVGLWRPETKAAYQIRQQIADHPADWKRATRGTRFTDVFALTGDSLVRPPKGYDGNHPLIDDLKRKDFIASTRLTQSQLTSDQLMEDVTDYCRRGAPFMKFLCEAVGVPF
ncbi:MAG: DUF2461 domain-containing protein [Acidimicrobiia bacterium]|nr:DUF2461 domain-containing protein [Acidimicrobiia bacterium]